MRMTLFSKRILSIRTDVRFFARLRPKEADCLFDLSARFKLRAFCYKVDCTAWVLAPERGRLVHLWTRRCFVPSLRIAREVTEVWVSLIFIKRKLLCCRAGCLGKMISD